LNTKTEPRFLSTTAFVKDKNDKKKIIVIGGLGLNKSNNRYPTIETLEEKKGWLENKNINKDEEIPYLTKPRWGHSCSVVDNKIYLIGGFDHQSMYNDVNIYDFENEKIININDTNKKFSHRACHSAVSYNNNILLFGGQVYKDKNGYEFKNDFHIFNTEKKRMERN